MGSSTGETGGHWNFRRVEHPQRAKTILTLLLGVGGWNTVKTPRRF